MPRETFDAITESQINRASIATLADRPNSVSRYGDSNLSAQELKERFDAFPHLVQKKINEIIAALASASAAKYITIADHSTGKDNLYDFIALFTKDASNEKSIADFIYALYTAEKAASPASKSISEIFNDMASRIAALESARVALQESVSNHEERISSNESGIANHDERISANETNITNHETRILGIERYLGGDNFIVDDAIAYQKDVPKNAVGKAKILKIGGMTYKSKNLIPFPYADTSKTENGVTWTLNTDGSVTANGTATAHSYFALFNSSTLLTIPYDMTLSGSPSGGGDIKYQIHIWKDQFAIADNGISAKVPAGTTYKEIYAVVRKGYTADNLTFKPMLNAGTTALPYEPYFSGLRNAAVEEVNSEGVNKFDISKAIKSNGSFTVSNGAIVWTHNGEGDYFAFGYWLDCEPNTNYTVALSAVSIRQVYVYTDTFYGNRIFCDFLTGGKLTFNSGENKRLLLAFYSLGSQRIGTSETISNIQIEKGISATEYKPYVGTLDTFAIPQAVQEIDGWGLNENYIVWTDNKVKFVQEYKREIVTSTSIGWAKYMAIQDYHVYFGAPKGKAVGLNTSICSHFSQKDYAWDAGVVGEYSDHPNTNNVYFNSDKTTLEEWKAWLDEQNESGNPVVLVYKLETPIVTDITDLISSYNFIKVEGGGSIVAVNEYGYAVPSGIKYLVTYPKEV